MNRDQGSSDSPLEELLEGIAPPTPPADLRDRCLATVRELADRDRVRRRQWRPLWAAAAAGLILTMVGVGMLPQMQPQRAASAGSGEKHVGASTAAHSQEVTAANAPALAPTATPAPQEPRRRVLDEAKRTSTPTAPPAAVGARTANGLEVAAGDSIMRYEGFKRSVPPPPGRSDSFGYGGPEAPWYDASPERQKIVQSTLELAVREVDEAYASARATVEKSGGYVENEELSQNPGERPRAHFTARVPVDKLDGVVAQLRDLGETVSLKTESEDVDREYRGEGARIRENGATEDELVRRYLAEKDRWLKQQVYDQIMALRARNSGQKRSLRHLSEETHFARLDVTLTQRVTPLRFLADLGGHSANAAAWVLATAVIWLPLLVLALLALRRKP